MQQCRDPGWATHKSPAGQTKPSRACFGCTHSSEQSSQNPNENLISQDTAALTLAAGV